MMKDDFYNLCERSLMNHKTKIFLLCCELRSFTAVAKAQKISLSGVSKTISSLEQELGIQLFERHTRPLKATAEALLLQKFFLDVSGDFLQFMTGLREKNNLKPVLRVGVIGSLSLNLGVEIVREYFPKTTLIVVKMGAANTLVEYLNERQLDLIIADDVQLPSKHFYRYEIFEEPSILLLPKALEKSRNRVWTWDRLAKCGYALIGTSERSGEGNINSAFLLANNLHFLERLNVEGNALMMNLVALGLGWVFTRPTTVLRCRELEKDVYVAPMQPPVLSRKIFVIGRESEFVPQALELKRFCEEYLHKKLVPEILSIAPWIKKDIRIGCRPIVGSE